MPCAAETRTSFLIHPTGDGSEHNTGRDHAAVNRQASADAPSPSSVSSYGVARSDSRPHTEDPSQTDHRLSMVVELSSASQLSQLHMSETDSLHGSQSEPLPRQHSLSVAERARMRAMGITFGAGLSAKTEQEVGSREETPINTAQRDLMKALLSLQVCMCVCSCRTPFAPNPNAFCPAVVPGRI